MILAFLLWLAWRAGKRLGRMLDDELQVERFVRSLGGEDFERWRSENKEK